MTTIIEPGQIWLAKGKTPRGFRRLLEVVSVDASGNGFVEGVSYWQQQLLGQVGWEDDPDPHAKRKTRTRASALPSRYTLFGAVIPDHQQTSTPEQRATADAGAELMDRAADHLDQLGMHVTVNPWRPGAMAGRIEAVCPNGETWHVASDVGEGDAPWIATMNGHVGEGIVALLRSLAEEAREVSPNPHGVELARRILGVPPQSDV